VSLTQLYEVGYLTYDKILDTIFIIYFFIFVYSSFLFNKTFFYHCSWNEDI